MAEMTAKKVTKDDLFWVFIKSNFLLGSFNFERMQAMGFCVAMIPILKRVYEGDELKKALRRHLEFFNTQPFVAAAIMGISWINGTPNRYGRPAATGMQTAL